MQKLLDIRIFFYLRTSYSNTDGMHPIILRIIYRGETRDIFTGLYCFKTSWVKPFRKVSPSDPEAGVINSNMEMMHHKAMDEFDRLRFRGIPFSIGQLMQNIRGKEAPPQTLQEYIAIKLQELRLRINVDITPSTYRKYKSCIHHMEMYLQDQYKVKNIVLPGVNKVFVSKFFSYLRTEKNISHNVAMNYMKTLKTFLLPAVHEGILSSNPFLGFKMTFKKVFVDFLTRQEVFSIR